MQVERRAKSLAFRPEALILRQVVIDGGLRMVDLREAVHQRALEAKRAHAARKLFRLGPLSGKEVETSLIEQFLYPALGPGAMWENVAQKVRERAEQLAAQMK